MDKEYFETEVFPAKGGDCFLVRCFDGKNKTNILIDAGRKETITKLKTRLEYYSRKLGEKIDLFVITHIDGDHISGAINLLQQNGDNEPRKIIDIKEIWHNSYKQIANYKSNYKETSLKKIKEKVKNILKKLDILLKEGTISPKEGSELAVLIFENKYIWNNATKGKAISLENLKTVTKNKNVTIELLSPIQDKLDILRTYWDKVIDEKIQEWNENINEPLKRDQIERYLEILLLDKEFSIYSNILMNEGLIAGNVFSKDINEEELRKVLLQAKKDGSVPNEDSSIPNGSSISFILTFQNKSILFLGDSHPALIMKSLKTKFPEISPANPKRFDLIKISHHGSFNNTSLDFLQSVYSNKYLISTDGLNKKNNHPDENIIKGIIAFPDNKESKELIFNYKIPKIEALKKNKQYGKTFTITQGDKGYMKIQIGIK